MITARPTKCLLGANRMEILGHQVGGDVITRAVITWRNTPRQTTKKQVGSFLGLIGYYRDHKPAFAKISAPLTDLLKKGKAEHIQCSEAHSVYSFLKEYLLQKPVLKLTDHSYYGQSHPELEWRLCCYKKTTGNFTQWAIPARC